MNQPARTPRQHPVTQDIPLPGHYQCLTLQLNVTRYQANGAIRMVMVVREPSDHVEIGRLSMDDALDSDALIETMASALIQQLTNMRYMQQGRSTD